MATSFAPTARQAATAVRVYLRANGVKNVMVRTTGNLVIADNLCTYTLYSLAQLVASLVPAAKFDVTNNEMIRIHA